MHSTSGSSASRRVSRFASEQLVVGYQYAHPLGHGIFPPPSANPAWSSRARVRPATSSSINLASWAKAKRSRFSTVGIPSLPGLGPR